MTPRRLNSRINRLVPAKVTTYRSGAKSLQSKAAVIMFLSVSPVTEAPSHLMAFSLSTQSKQLCRKNSSRLKLSIFDTMLVDVSADTIWNFSSTLNSDVMWKPLILKRRKKRSKLEKYKYNYQLPISAFSLKQLISLLNIVVQIPKLIPKYTKQNCYNLIISYFSINRAHLVLQSV